MSCPPGRTVSSLRMRAFSRRWTDRDGWSEPLDSTLGADVQLALAFGPSTAPEAAWFAAVAAAWPAARVVYVTSGGQVTGRDVVDDEVVVTGLAFDATTVRVVQGSGLGHEETCEAMGARLGRELAEEAALRHVLVFADGLQVNGAALTRGFAAALPATVSISGGLASDGSRFERTGVGLDGPPRPGQVIAIGLYGDALAVGTGSVGGWEPFGPERLVTRSDGTTVFELDNEPALDVYRRYLGPLAAELPASALLFPLGMVAPHGGPPLVRTLLGIDDEARSLRFAGEVPQGGRVRLMRATNEHLIDAAQLAASAARDALADTPPVAVLCVSCIGRRVVLRSRIAEEIDEVASTVPDAVIAGFYSNGEIAPLTSAVASDDRTTALFHNQTMTLTVLGER